MYAGCVLITGSNKGLGKSLAVKFAEQGYDIILHGRNKKDLEDASCDKVFWSTKKPIIIRGDLTEQKVVNKLIKIGKKKSINVLINNAGSHLEEIKTIETNLISPIKLIEGLYKTIGKNKGIIININSLAGKSCNSSEPIYCSSKFGLKAYSNSVRFDIAKYGASLLNIYLGRMDTTMIKKDKKDLIKTDEVAGFIYSLSEKHNSFQITNIEIMRKWKTQKEK